MMEKAYRLCSCAFELFEQHVLQVARKRVCMTSHTNFDDQTWLYTFETK